MTGIRHCCDLWRIPFSQAKPKVAFDVCHALYSGAKADIAGGLRRANERNRPRGRAPGLATRQ
jgi:hypothetical protein